MSKNHKSGNSTINNTIYFPLCGALKHHPDGRLTGPFKNLRTGNRSLAPPAHCTDVYFSPATPSLLYALVGYTGQLNLLLYLATMKTYTFIKEGSSWYIDLPAFIEQGGSKGDLEMVEGADTMLEIMSNNGSSVTLTIDRTPFDEADVLDLVERCDPYVGGGYYQLHSFEGKVFNKTMWLCGVTEFVFGDLPEQIFVRREKD